jgi:hypothetical protein
LGEISRHKIDPLYYFVGRNMKLPLSLLIVASLIQVEDGFLSQFRNLSLQAIIANIEKLNTGYKAWKFVNNLQNILLGYTGASLQQSDLFFEGPSSQLSHQCSKSFNFHPYNEADFAKIQIVMKDINLEVAAFPFEVTKNRRVWGLNSQSKSHHYSSSYLTQGDSNYVSKAEESPRQIFHITNKGSVLLEVDNYAPFLCVIPNFKSHFEVETQPLNQIITNLKPQIEALSKSAVLAEQRLRTPNDDMGSKEFEIPVLGRGKFSHDSFQSILNTNANKIKVFVDALKEFNYHLNLVVQALEVDGDARFSSIMKGFYASDYAKIVIFSALGISIIFLLVTTACCGLLCSQKRKYSKYLETIELQRTEDHALIRNLTDAVNERI